VTLGVLIPDKAGTLRLKKSYSKNALATMGFTAPESYRLVRPDELSGAARPAHSPVQTSPQPTPEQPAPEQDASFEGKRAAPAADNKIAVPAAVRPVRRPADTSREVRPARPKPPETQQMPPFMTPMPKPQQAADPQIRPEPQMQPANPENKVRSEIGVEPEAQARPNIQAKPETRTEPQPERQAQLETQTEPQPKRQAQPETRTEPQPERQAQLETRTEPQPERQAQPETRTEPQPERQAPPSANTEQTKPQDSPEQAEAGTGAETVPAEKPGAADGWFHADQPETLFSDPDFADICRGVSNALTKQAGELTLLAVPVSPDEPFPMMPVFCLGDSGRIGGREYIVFRIKNGKLALQ
jgi:hypothetical protein